MLDTSHKLSQQEPQGEREGQGWEWWYQPLSPWPSLYMASSACFRLSAFNTRGLCQKITKSNKWDSSPYLECIDYGINHCAMEPTQAKGKNSYDYWKMNLSIVSSLKFLCSKSSCSFHPQSSDVFQIHISHQLLRTNLLTPFHPQALSLSRVGWQWRYMVFVMIYEISWTLCARWACCPEIFSKSIIERFLVLHWPKNLSNDHCKIKVLRH